VFFAFSRGQSAIRNPQLAAPESGEGGSAIRNCMTFLPIVAREWRVASRRRWTYRSRNIAAIIAVGEGADRHTRGRECFRKQEMAVGLIEHRSLKLQSHAHPVNPAHQLEA